MNKNTRYLMDVILLVNPATMKMKDIKRLGNGDIYINNGIMTVEKEGRTLDTGYKRLV